MDEFAASCNLLRRDKLLRLDVRLDDSGHGDEAAKTARRIVANIASLPSQ
jgi:hypothetical protein